MLDQGQFPAFCPQCRADSGGKELTKGRILRPALTFLQQRNVITKEFQFRFVTAMKRQAREELDDYFECPKKCGNFLVVEPDKVALKVTKDEQGQFRAVVRLGKCPECGGVCCPKCKKPVTLDDDGNVVEVPCEQPS